MGSQQDPPAGSGPPEDETNVPGHEPGAAQPPPWPPPAGGTAQPPPWPPAPEPPTEEPGGEAGPPPPGSMRFQDASTTEPRPPTVAEARARERAERKHQEIEEARLAAEEKRRKRNRRLIGGAAVVGVVGLVAGLGYWALSSSNRKHVTAQCVQDDPGGNPVVVPDSYCTGHTAHSSGFFYYGGHGYRYYYGSSGDIGQRPTGGSTVAPKGATITTKSGSPVQRGGLGSSGSSKGGGS